MPDVLPPASTAARPAALPGEPTVQRADQTATRGHHRLPQGVRLSKVARPWVASLVMHTLLLMFLALWVLPQLDGGRIERFSGSLITTDPVLPEFAIQMPAGPPPPDAADGLDEPTPVTLVLDPQPVRFEPLPLTLPGNTLPSNSALPKDADSRIAIQRPTQARKSNLPPARPASNVGEVRHSDGVAGASDLVNQAIRSELDQGDTLVVWLLDASISLSQNRELLAQRTAALYKSVGAFNTSRDEYTGEHTLMSSVVSFGRGWSEVLRPTRMGAQAVEAMRRVTIDTSGIEHVMNAVSQSVQLYRQRRHRKDRMIIVVLTDESGDDLSALESTIALCREQRVGVHVIGPSAVMGTRKGSQHCVLTQNDVNYSFWLTVNKGPETSLPERMLLPYWHESSVPAWQQQGATVGHSNWYGGNYRERIPSGFGPYALTRLALETGGSFTRFERLPMQAAYDMDKLRDYVPDYGSAVEYLESLDGRPLRQFIREAAAMGFQKAPLFVVPRLTFMGGRSAYYPYEVEHYYFSPPDFRDRLQFTLSRERARVLQASELLARLIIRLTGPDVDWEYEYQQESSPRWRAWYDLTRGRIFATQARYLEYLAATEQIMVILAAETNEVNLFPASPLRHPNSPSLIAEAMRCLNRCVSENGQTPWSDLARWEQATSIGLRIEQSTIPRPPPRIGRPTRQPEQFKFPNL